MTPEKVKECVSLIRSFPGGEAVFIEASGGITLETLPDYVWTGIDAVSIGALTARAKSVDLRMDLK
jgi:nicotinate-nucleotide pyrophosphorylase (carboxylating)